MEDFKVSLRRPFFGHGLGTSREANANFRGEDKPSHNLYTEVAEELGYIGLALMLMLLWSFLRACWTAERFVSASPLTDARLRFLHDVARALVVVVMVDLFFSFASFGFSEPYWYLFGGLSVVTARLAAKLAPDRAGALRRSSAAQRRRLRRRFDNVRRCLGRYSVYALGSLRNVRHLRLCLVHARSNARQAATHERRALSVRTLMGKDISSQEQSV